MLILCGLAHAQFETIHPFLDGNGRVGRLLITFLLCQREILHHPLLYLSSYLKTYRTEYYEQLMAVRREGDWESWLKFFLRGVCEVSRSATITARAILDLREEHHSMLGQQRSNSANGLLLLDYLFTQPLLNLQMIQQHLGCAYITASRLVEQFVTLGLLQETTGWQRNRRYRYSPYLALFEQPPLPAA